jgi:hypothetical protein
MPGKARQNDRNEYRTIKKCEDHMSNKRQFSMEEARLIGTQLKIDWSQIDLEQFRRGL